MDKDYVVSDIKINFEGTLSLEEFYKYMKKWFSQYKFDLEEKEFNELKDGRKIQIVWNAEKEYNDYIKYVIEIDFTAKNIEEIEDSKKNMVSCSIELSFNALLAKDYDERWNKGPITKIIKETYTKYVKKDIMDRCRTDLKDSVKRLTNEIKAYLNLRKA
ncbi:MAG TPA: hypothetical protein VJB94_05190 [Candidatus Nanoarchaeia archaeon]|nr:hypothetical protein [Candidatus Nanoarchaeia archaeon]